MDTRRTFPIHLDLSALKCVVIGGGRVAERRVKRLMECGANPVVVVSPEVTAALALATDSGAVTLLRQPYDREVLTGAHLVFAATDSPDVNAQVARDARALGALVNVASSGADGDFLVPAALHRGALTISVSTDGSSPLLAERIVAGLAAQYDESYGVYIDILGRVRERLKSECPNPPTRHVALAALLDHEASIRAVAREQDAEAAYEAALAIAREALKLESLLCM
jgi:precorrin-2 dehydrogenase/sirohydrochlorin ferrochelatase